jgi:hypothetical protein
MACRPLNAEVAADAARTRLGASSSHARASIVQWNDWRFDVDQDQADDGSTSPAATPIAPSAPSNASIRPISRRVAEVAQHAELAAPRRTCELVLAPTPNNPISTATASSRYVTANVRSNVQRLADLARTATS